MLIVGDLHFDAPVRYERGGVNLYLERITEALWWVIRDVAEEKEAVVFLGDVFEKKDRIEARVKNRLVEILNFGLAQKGLLYLFLVGNHDITPSGHVSIQWLCRYGDVYGYPTEITVEDMDVYLLPYGTQDISYAKDFWKLWLVLGHVKLEGFEFENGIADSGFNVKEILKKFPGGAILINGHYHKFQVKDGAVALGSLVSTDFGDIGEKYILKVGNNSRKIHVPFGIDRKVLKIASDDDLGKLEVTDLSGKFVRFDVVVDRVNIEALRSIIEKKDIEWYEFNFVTSGDRSSVEIESSDVIADLDRYISDAMQEIEESKREVYRKVIAQANEDL